MLLSTCFGWQRLVLVSTCPNKLGEFFSFSFFFWWLFSSQIIWWFIWFLIYEPAYSRSVEHAWREAWNRETQMCTEHSWSRETPPCFCTKLIFLQLNNNNDYWLMLVWYCEGLSTIYLLEIKVFLCFKANKNMFDNFDVHIKIKHVFVERSETTSYRNKNAGYQERFFVY